MRNDDTAYDGQPIQAGLHRRNLELTGRVPAYTLDGFREMVVVGRNYVKAEGNQSAVTVEYTCRDLINGDLVPGCRRLDVMSGATGGDDNVLHPSETLRPGATPSNTGIKYSPASMTDGDHVVVVFIESSRARPVILGVLRHQDATYGAEDADGERRLTLHKDTSVEFKKDGTYVITRKETSITVAEDQTITVKQGSGSTITLKTNGDVTVDAVRDVNVNAARDVTVHAERNADVTAGLLVSLGSTPLVPVVDGVVTGEAIDVITGFPMWFLGYSSAKVMAKK